MRSGLLDLRVRPELLDGGFFPPGVAAVAFSATAIAEHDCKSNSRVLRLQSLFYNMLFYTHQQKTIENDCGLTAMHELKRLRSDVSHDI